MKKSSCIRVIAFGLIFLICLFFLSQCVVRNLARYGFSHVEFYEMEEPLDVAFVGASHAYCAFNPMILEEKYGLNGYVFGSSNQSMLSCYLWAKEAYEHNPYGILVVEAMSGTISHGDIEADVRSLNGMIGSPHFYELALTYKRNALNILFPLFMYHDEWEYMGQGAAVIKAQKLEENYSRGHVQLDSKAGDDYTEPMIKGDSETEEYVNFTYIDKIREFCDENNIQLVFVKALMADNSVNNWNEDTHYTIKKYCEGYNIPFIDFNTKEYIDAAGLEVSEDVAEDLRHANKYGAVKMTEYLGEWIMSTGMGEQDAI